MVYGFGLYQLWLEIMASRDIRSESNSEGSLFRQHQSQEDAKYGVLKIFKNNS